MITPVIFLFIALIFAIIWCRVTVSADKPGIGGRVYRNTGSYGSPSWTNQAFVASVTPTMPWGKIESGSRGTRAKTYMKTRADISIQIMFKADDSDAGYLAFRAAANSPTAVVDLLILDGLISVEGTHGWRGEFHVELASAPQEMDGSIYDTFEIYPSWTTNAAGPSTVIMAGSSVITPTPL